jgi:hypothetical protein
LPAWSPSRLPEQANETIPSQPRTRDRSCDVLRQKGQASLPAIVPPEPSLPAKPAIDGADAYFQRAAVGMAPGRMFKPNGKEGGYTFVDDGAAVPEGTPYVVQSDGIWVGQRRFHGEGVPPSHEGGLILGDPNFRIPARDELGDLDPSEWPIGKFTNMAEDPWRPTIYVPLEDRSSGTIVTLMGHYRAPSIFNFLRSGALMALRSRPMAKVSISPRLAAA